MNLKPLSIDKSMLKGFFVVKVFCTNKFFILHKNRKNLQLKRRTGQNKYIQTQKTGQNTHKTIEKTGRKMYCIVGG